MQRLPFLFLASEKWVIEHHPLRTLDSFLLSPIHSLSPYLIPCWGGQKWYQPQAVLVLLFVPVYTIVKDITVIRWSSPHKGGGGGGGLQLVFQHLCGDTLNLRLLFRHFDGE
jgi:hypothetical protein